MAVNGTESRWQDMTLKVNALIIDETAVTSSAAELNILDGVTATAAELNYTDITTAGTAQASKALVLDANKALAWAYTSASTNGSTSVEGFSFNTTMTGAGGVGGRARFELDTNVALGGWANALKAQTEFGASGSVTGLGSAFVAELILSAGTASGTYAGVEIEIGMPSGAVTGTSTSFLYLSLYGAAAGTFDTSGNIFELAGVTKGSGKVLADVTTGSTARPVQVLRVKTPDGTRYLPLYDTVAIGA